MLYRKFLRAPMDLPILGFGCMRLPVQKGRADRRTTGNNDDPVHDRQQGQLYRYRVPVTTRGRANRSSGGHSRNGYREKVQIVTKFP